MLAELRSLISPDDPDFSMRDQCGLLGIARSGLYYEPVGLSGGELALRRAIDRQYTQTPFYGRRRMVVAMRGLGFQVGQKHVRTAMQEMGLEAVYPRPHLSMSNKEHKKYPYLLRGMKICRPNQVWAADITYIPLQDGFGYLFAIIDWFSRMVIAWQISNLLDTEFCLEALGRALSLGSPEIFNTDQGVQFTSSGFTGRLEAGGIRISMDGRGRAFDNIMVERLWRTVKYEDVYLKGYETLPEASQGLGSYFSFYNKTRPHQSLGYCTPQEVYLLSV